LVINVRSDRLLELAGASIDLVARHTRDAGSGSEIIGEAGFGYLDTVVVVEVEAMSTSEAGGLVVAEAVGVGFGGGI